MAQNNVGRNGRAIVAKSSTIEGLKLHYLSAGQGPAAILLHGYTQTSRIWRPIIPRKGQLTH